MLHATVELNREIGKLFGLFMSLINNLFTEGFGNSSCVNQKTKSTSATSDLSLTHSLTLSHEFDQQSLCIVTDIELPFKF